MMLCSVSICNASDNDYWTQLNDAANRCFLGIDTKVLVGAGIEHRVFESRSRTAPYAEIKLEVPLYSAKDRRIQRRSKAKFLEHGADLLKDLTKAQARYDVLLEEAKILKDVMIQSGLSGIKEFFEIKQQVASTKAEIEVCRKKLEAWVASCGVK